jgi:hypothetical protein
LADSSSNHIPKGTCIFSQEALPPTASPISFLLLHARPLASNNYSDIGSTPSQRLYINATQAQAVIPAAANKALSVNPSSVVVRDPSGLVAFLRGYNAYPGRIDIIIKKRAP